MCYGLLWGRRETGVDAQGLTGHHCLLVWVQALLFRMQVWAQWGLKTDLPVNHLVWSNMFREARRGTTLMLSRSHSWTLSSTMLLLIHAAMFLNKNVIEWFCWGTYSIYRKPQDYINPSHEQNNRRGLLLKWKFNCIPTPNPFSQQPSTPITKVHQTWKPCLAHAPKSSCFVLWSMHHSCLTPKGTPVISKLQETDVLCVF